MAAQSVTAATLSIVPLHSQGQAPEPLCGPAAEPQQAAAGAAVQAVPAAAPQLHALAAAVAREQPSSSSQESAPRLLEPHAAALEQLRSSVRQGKFGRHLMPDVIRWIKDADAAVTVLQQGFRQLRSLPPMDAAVSSNAALLRELLATLDETQVTEREAVQAALDGVLDCQLRPPHAAMVISGPKGSWGVEMTADIAENAPFCKYFDLVERAFTMFILGDRLEQDSSRLPSLDGARVRQPGQQAVAAPAAANRAPSKQLRSTLHTVWRKVIYPHIQVKGVRAGRFACAWCRTWAATWHCFPTCCRAARAPVRLQERSGVQSGGWQHILPGDSEAHRQWRGAGATVQRVCAQGGGGGAPCPSRPLHMRPPSPDSAIESSGWLGMAACMPAACGLCVPVEVVGGTCLQYVPAADSFAFANSVHSNNPIKGLAEVFRAFAGVCQVGHVGIKRLQGRVLGLRHPMCGFLPLGIGSSDSAPLCFRRC